MSKTVKCPKWGCDGVGIPVDTKKKFSFGKALVGNTVGGLFGPVGAVVGAAALSWMILAWLSQYWYINLISHCTA
jgi:hypothetical protein